MKKQLGLWIVGIGLLATQGLASGFYFGAHGAYTMGGDVEKEEMGYGAQLGINVLDTFAIELSGTLIQDETANADVDYDVGNFALTATLGFEIADLLAPYIGGGINYNRFSFDSNSITDLEDTDQVGFHLCGGVRTTLSDCCQLFAEYRYNMLTESLNDMISDELNLDLYTSSDNFSFGMVRVGINFTL